MSEIHKQAVKDRWGWLKITHETPGYMEAQKAFDAFVEGDKDPAVQHANEAADKNLGIFSPLRAEIEAWSLA